MFFGGDIGFVTTSSRALIRRFCKLFACLVASSSFLFSKAFFSELLSKSFKLLLIIFLLNLVLEFKSEQK